MEKKLILLIVGVVILVVVMAALVVTGSDQRVKVGDASFSLPEGFEQGNYNHGDINITNGVNSIFLKEYSINDTKKILDSYANVTHERGNNISFSNFTVGDTLVFKSNIPNDENNVHYWFNYKDKTYSIYFWDNTPNKDVYVKDLITSVKKAVY